MKTLVIDVGGTHVKVLATGRRVPVKIDSGPQMTPSRMVAEVKAATADWEYERISIGIPTPIRNDRAVREPWNLGRGWVGFDFAKAFGKPVRLLNDAAMQALGAYRGRRMLFLGLGTGLGSTLIVDDVIIPLELAHLPYHDGKSYEQYLGDAGWKRLGTRKWRKHVLEVIELFMAAFGVDYVVLGGGNARHMKVVPRYVKVGKNADAFAGGFRMWSADDA